MLRHPRPVGLVAFALVFAVTTAGCGGGSSSAGAPATTASSTATKAAIAPSTATQVATPVRARKLAYEGAMKKLSANLSDALRTIGSDDLTILQDDTSTTPQAIARMVRNLERGRTALRAAAAKLGSIPPPAAVAADHRQLRKGLRDLATELEPIIQQVRLGHGQIAITAIAGQKGIAEMQRASQDIVRHGYAIT